MAHFYGAVQGAQGEATRQGSQYSGINSYVQTWQARIATRMSFDTIGRDRNSASITLTGGPSNHRAPTKTITITDVDMLIDALGTDDPKIKRAWDRIQDEFAKLNEEAPGAVKRAADRKAKAERKIERENKRRDKEQKTIIRDMQPEEKARIVRIFPLVEVNSDGNFDSGVTELKDPNRGNLRIGNDGHVYVNAPLGFGWFPFDVTDAVWVLPEEPKEFGMTEDKQQGFGVRVVNEEEVTA